jgi:hypothetical protein
LLLNVYRLVRFMLRQLALIHVGGASRCSGARLMPS